MADIDALAKKYGGVVVNTPAQPTTQPIVEETATNEIPVPRRQYGFGEALIEAPYNLPSSGAKLLGGLADMVANPKTSLSAMWDAAAGAIGLAVPDNVREFMGQLDKNPAAAERAMATARMVGADYAAKYGDWSAIKRTIAEDPVGAAADLSTLFTGGAGAARGFAKTGVSTAGKVAGGLQTAARYTDPLSLVAPVVETGGKAIGGTANYLARVANPKATALMDAAEGKAPEIINALRNYDQYVAQGMPTAGVAAVPVGATKYAALQAEAAKRMPSEYLAREEANVAARRQALGGIAQDEAALAAAEKARAAATKPLYGIADKQIIKADDTFNALLERPSMEKAVARAKELAKERGEQLQIGKNIPEQKVGSTIVDTEGKPLDVKTIPAEYAKFNGKSLHYLKLALDDLIKDPKSFGLGSNEVAAISKTRGEFLNWFEGKSNKYAEARQAYTQMSKPINVMQVGQYLEGKLIPALETPASERAGVFAGAVKEAPTTIKRSTGQTRFKQLTDILEPDQVKIVEDIRKDLAREAQFERQAKRGAEAGKNIPAEELAKSPSYFSRIATTANTIVNKLQGRINEKVALELAVEMLDPKLAAAALEKAAARQARGERLVDPFKRGGAGASRMMRGETGLGLRSPLTLGGVQIQNALAPENQNNLGAR